MYFAHASITKAQKLTCTQSHNLLTLTVRTTYGRLSSWAGQLAGIKLDPWVPRCSLGLKAMLKRSPIVLQNWGNMDRGQENQSGASHTPGGLHLLCLYMSPAHTGSAWHIVSCPYASPTSLHALYYRTTFFHRGTELYRMQIRSQKWVIWDFRTSNTVFSDTVYADLICGSINKGSNYPIL